VQIPEQFGFLKIFSNGSKVKLKVAKVLFHPLLQTFTILNNFWQFEPHFKRLNCFGICTHVSRKFWFLIIYCILIILPPWSRKPSLLFNYIRTAFRLNSFFLGRQFLRRICIQWLCWSTRTFLCKISSKFLANCVL